MMRLTLLDKQLVIFLLHALSWCCRFAHNVVWRWHQLRVEIDSWRNKALLVEIVQVRATVELDHGTFREYRGATIQTGIVSSDCSDTHVSGCVLCLSL